MLLNCGFICNNVCTYCQRNKVTYLLNIFKLLWLLFPLLLCITSLSSVFGKKKDFSSVCYSSSLPPPPSTFALWPWCVSQPFLPPTVFACVTLGLHSLLLLFFLIFFSWCIESQRRLKTFWGDVKLSCTPWSSKRMSAHELMSHPLLLTFKKFSFNCVPTLKCRCFLHVGGKM